VQKYEYCNTIFFSQKVIAEEETVQRAALDLLKRKKDVGSSKKIEQIAADYDIIGGNIGKTLICINAHTHACTFTQHTHTCAHTHPYLYPASPYPHPHPILPPTWPRDAE